MPRWIYQTHSEEEVKALQQSLRISPILAKLLLNRGFKDLQKAKEFLNPSLDQLQDPELFVQMKLAVDRIFKAVEKKEIILVYGDYDVDGVSGTSLLYNYFRFLQTPVQYYSPDRIQEGYGLNCKAFDQFSKKGVKVVITVDCGTSNIEEVDYARKKGIEVIITDHHETPEVLPKACAILNPKLADSGYPFASLCGAGVAFKLAWALSQRLCKSQKVSPEFRRLLLESMSLVALGTVADLVPLVGENRVFVRFGLNSFSVGKRDERFVFKGAKGHKGLEALIQVAQLDKNSISEEDIGFRLGPMMNAAGRLARATLGIELLTTNDSPRAFALARELQQKNQERRKLEKVVFEKAKEQFLSSPEWQTRFGIVLAHADWHPGVIGIVASRMVEHFHRPTLIINLYQGIGKGSGRSIGQINLHQVLSRLQQKLIKFGGHAAAAGFSIKEADIPWLSEAFDLELKKIVSPSDLAPQLHVDCEMLLSDIDFGLLRELKWLSPFGQGNPAPVFSTKNVRVAGKPKRIGASGVHLSFHVSHYGVSHRVIAFQMGDQEEQLKGAQISIAYIPKMSLYQNHEQIHLEIKDLKILD